MKKDRVIGRGLDALLNNTDNDDKQRIDEVNVNDIDINPNQPRKTFDDTTIDELAISIKSIGLVQPITLQKQSNGRYLLIAGERRYRAAKKIGLNRIPAYIKEISSDDILEVALIENIQRQDLNPIEIALSLEGIMKEKGLTHEKLSQTLGKSRASVTNYLRLLKLPAEIQLGLTKELISMGHAKALLSITNVSDQLHIYKQILNKGLSVREVELLTKNKEKKSNTSSKNSDNNPLGTIANMLSDTFKTKVSIEQNNKGKGRLTIPFNNDEDLERIIRLLEQLQNRQ